MASSGLRRAYGLAALFANIHLAVSQITSVTSGVVGFVVEDDVLSTSVTCELNNYQVYTNLDSDGPYLFCDATTDYWMATACIGDSTILYVTTGDLTSAEERTYTCASTCTSLTVVEEYPSSGSSYMIYDCDEFMGVPSGVSVVYQTVLGIDSILTSSESESTTEATADGTRGDSNQPSETNSLIGGGDDDDDNSSSSSDGGPDVPVIVGAVVGSVAGVALIIAAIFIGIRIGKKKAAAGATANVAAGPMGASPGTGMVAPGQPQMVWPQQQPGLDPNQMQQVPPPMSTSPGLDKYGGPPPVVMATGIPQPYTHSYMQPAPYPQQQQQQQQQVPQGYYPPQGYHRPEQYSPQPSQPSQPSTDPVGGPPELPTGASAQGWASGEDHPHPYEMEAMLQPDQRNSPRPQ